MDKNIIYDVDTALDVKRFIVNNLDDIDFDNIDLKKNIINSADDDLLRIGKTISSPIRIMSVDLINADFFRRNLFKENGDSNRP